MYYSAILCPTDIDKDILQFKHWMKEHFGCTVALRSPAHITLIPPFWLEEEKEKELQDVLRSFSSDVSSIEIHFNGFSHFNKRVLFVNVKENPAMEELKKQAEAHFIQYFNKEIKMDDRPFHPHVTIANRDVKPSDFRKAWEYFSKKDFTASFYTSTISLLKLSPGKWDIIGGKNW